MSEPLKPSQVAGIRAINAAVYAYLHGDSRDAVRILQAAVRAGLTEEVVSGLLGLTVSALEALAEQTGTDVRRSWAMYLQTNSVSGGESPWRDR